MEIEIKQTDPLAFAGDALVLPTNSYGQMLDGLALRIKQTAGNEIETEAAKCAPIAVGAAVVTSPGSLGIKKLIHVPVVEHPGMRMGIESVRKATRAGLLAAKHFKYETICIPGFGYGENGIPYDETARAIIDEIHAFKGGSPSRVILTDTDPSMVLAFREQVED